jgi:hypothetical protein
MTFRVTRTSTFTIAGERRRTFQTTAGDSPNERIDLHRFPSALAFVADSTPNAAEAVYMAEHYSSTAAALAGGNVSGARSQWVFGDAEQGWPAGIEALRAQLRGGAPPPAPLLAVYADMRAAIASKLGALKTNARTLRRTRCYRIDSGDELDVDRVLSGAPEIWRGRTRGKKRPSVTLAVQLGQLADSGAADYARIIGLAVAAAEVIESAGLAVTILGVYAASGMEKLKARPEAFPGTAEHCCVTFPLKSSEEPLRPERLLAFGQSGAHRSYGFAQRALRFGCDGGMGASWVPPARHPLRAHLGVSHWIGKVPVGGNVVEILEGILRDTVPGIVA